MAYKNILLKHCIPNFHFNFLIISNYTFVFYSLGMLDWGERKESDAV